MPSPTKVVLIRHAEKPPAAGPPPAGVHEDGSPHDHSLTVRGWQRSGALAAFFTHPWDPALAPPDHLYSPPRRHDDGDHGRPFQTLIALSDVLQLPVNTSYALDSEAELAADVRTREGVVLIAWEHKRIPTIANALLGDAGSAPQTWPDDRFDLVWILDRQPNGRYRFSARPQRLLHGDRADPGPSAADGA